jgi:hypothetical protein
MLFPFYESIDAAQKLAKIRQLFNQELDNIAERELGKMNPKPPKDPSEFFK